MRAEVQSFVKAFVEAFNKVDVSALMEMYSRQAGVTSVGDGEVTRGWDAIRTDADEMVGMEGTYKLSLGVIDVTPMGSSHALAVASMKVKVTGQEGSVDLPGAFTFVVQKVDASWVIIHDHWSSKAQAYAMEPQGD